MARLCPRCRSQNPDTTDHCTTCGIELGAPRPEPEPVSFIEPKAYRTQRDPFVAIWEGPTPEGHGIAKRLEAGLIPVELGEAAEPGRLRLEVPQSYVDEAYGILETSDPEAPDGWASSAWDDEDDLELTSDAMGWSPAIRLVLMFAAAALIIALVVTR